LYYMAILADTKDMPRFSESFEKRYTKLRQLISQQEVTQEIFSVRSDSSAACWLHRTNSFESSFLAAEIGKAQLLGVGSIR